MRNWLKFKLNARQQLDSVVHGPCFLQHSLLPRGFTSGLGSEQGLKDGEITCTTSASQEYKGRSI